MFNRPCFVVAAILLLSMYSHAQTTAGLITGLVTDSSGAAVTGAEVVVTNTGTGVLRTATSGDNGIYLVLDLSPGIYAVSVKKEGFAAEKRENIQLEVNQSVTLNFKLGVSSAVQTVTVTGAAPLLNTTSATLSTVVDHEAVVDLPLNGREFTQLTLLTPGAAPSVTGQQGTFTISMGAGVVSPSINGQQGYENNYTMDGVLNNAIYTDIWAIAPPPDAIQEFNVQAHITDAQFAVSSGANINLVTRSGTNTFHGALWEFLRNDVLDTQTFPATTRLPYHQNQYGLYFGGPVIVPHLINGRNNTWFSLYWEGFRSAQTQTKLASTLTPNMKSGNFSAELGTTSIGTDCNGQPEYADELYDPTTSVADPCHAGEFLRTPFKYNGALNVIPPGRLNSASQAIVAKYYPSPNLNVAENVLPNYQFPGATALRSDIFGIRMDHQFTQNDIAFARFNRSNAHRTSPEALPTYDSLLSNYSQQAVLGYTHIFNPKTIFNFRYGYTYVNDLDGDQPAGEAFANSVNFLQAVPVHDGISEGPAVNIANGYSGVSQTIYPLGPLETMDYHVDLTKIIGHHALGAGAVYEHLRAYDDGWRGIAGFTQNATAQDGLAGPTGYGPASFMLGALDSYAGWIGNTGVGQTANWYGFYVQDQWQLTKRIVVIAGLRWDYVSPPNFHKVVSAFNPLNGTFVVTGPVSGYTGTTGPSGFYNPQYNGYEPRFGITYAATERIVVHTAFAVLDDHNNTLVQENQSLRLSWPTANATSMTSLDLGLPTTFINNLPTASSILASLQPVPSYAGNPNNRIPYSMQYNFGVETQLSNSMALKLDYVGSVNRHQYFAPTANSALTPGPGAVKGRGPYPQYGTFTFYWNEMPTSYNALQAEVHKSMASGLTFLASYTWSKSLDWTDPYGSVGNIYNLNGEWGPSTLNFKHIFVLSGVYALPLGRGKMLLGSANRAVQAIAGNWNLGSIISLHSGTPFNAATGSDIANIGNSTQRPNRIAGASPYAAQQTPNGWLSTAGFAEPATYTFGNERKGDLTGPAYRDIDSNLTKDFPITESTRLQFKAEAFNIFNYTNYSNPTATLNSSAFGKISSAAGTGREVQFALKLLF